MEYGQDSEPNADVRFISRHIPVFSPEECTFPTGNCSLVASATKFGRIFVACGAQIKVYDSRTLWEGPTDTPLATLSVGAATITHVATSCDGLTLLVTILHNQTPHALFYDTRGFVSGCGQQTPYVSMALGGAGSQVQALAWNPTDPTSVAVALAPSLLMLLILKENKVETKVETIEARALGWSPKGKQLTVGLEDGTLKLFKPDLAAVRNIQRPPMNEAGAVLSVTWFNNTEFFIGYKSSVEEGAHVIMYVNAPKAKEPKFVAYEYVCNYNQGPLQPLFYPHYFPEWSLLCLLSSRAVVMAVLGRPAGSTEGWCEYEIDEGCVAAVHNVSITEETFPLGLAVDFTSQKTFTAKDNKVSGPCPVLCTLSTGGELNLFHVVNEKSGAEPLIKLPENLPTTGLRTPQQFGRLASYVVTSATPSTAPTTFPAPFTAVPPSQTPVAPSPAAAPQPKLDTLSFNPPAQASSPFSASPLQSLSTSFKLPQTQSQSPGLFPKSEPAAAAATPSFFNVQAQSVSTTVAPTTSATTYKPPQSTDTPQDFKFLSSALRQSGTPVSTGSPVPESDTKPPVTLTTTTTTTAPAAPKAPDMSVATPSRLPQVSEVDETLLATIEAARLDFERELEDHKAMGDLPNKIGEQEEMGQLRCSLGEASEWVDQMCATTSELKGEVGQLHSEVLEGFTLAEEAEAHVTKNKNPRHRCALQPQSLDPHSRKQLEEIRSRYQYLQSQLSEIDLRLHLDWAAYRNEQNKKKKKELPASETLYQALKKCHYTRKVCERQVDTLCERIKDLHLHALSGLMTSHLHQDDDEILDSLEKSLRETSISAPPHSSPFKMLSPGKQESLQKALSQRNFIPLRKCSRSPRLNLTSLETLSPRHSQQASHHSSFSATTGHSLMDSFGPQTFSTPVRNNNNNSSSAPQTKDIAVASKTQPSEAVPAPKPQYEDITPPQTPDSRPAHNTKPASPLRALSRLVSEVPTTGASDAKTPGVTLLPEGKTAFRGFGEGGASNGGLKAPVTVASGPPLGAFRPVTCSSLPKTTLAFPFTQFVPPTTATQGSLPHQSQSLAGASGMLFQPPVPSENASFSFNMGKEVSQKPEVQSGIFFGTPSSVSDSHTQASDKPGTSAAPLCVPSGHLLTSGSQEQSPMVMGSTSTSGPISASQSFTSMALQPETDSVSSSSADSDTASSATVIGGSTEPPADKVGDTALDDTSTTQSNASSLKLSTSSTQQPISFLAASGSLFGGTSGTIMFGGNSSSNSAFLGAKTPSAAGGLAPPTTTTTMTSKSLFMVPATASGGFFSSAATTSSDSAVVTTPGTVSGTLFGAQVTTSSAKGVFGDTTAAPVTASATLTTTVATTPAPATLFDATPSSGATVFEIPTTSGGGIFGTAPTTTGTIFGTAGVFGGSTFGTAATTTAGSIFGSSASVTEPASGSATLVPATTTSGLFGAAGTSSSSSSLFGSSTTAVSTSGTGSFFGISAPASGSIFGATSTSGSLFSTAPTASTSTIFGVPSSSTGSEGIFGSSGSTSGSVSTGDQAKAESTTAGIFGLTQSTTSPGSLFGGGTSTSASTTTSTAAPSTPATSSTPVLTMGLFSAPPAGGSAFNISFASASGGSATSATPTLFATQTTSTTPTLFTQTTSATPTLFATQTTSTTPTLFTQTTSATPTLFATQTTSTAPSLFTQTTSTTPSLFTQTTSTTPTLFPTQTSSATATLFPTQTTAATPTLFTQTTSSAAAPFFTATSTTSAFTSLPTSSSAFTTPGSVGSSITPSSVSTTSSSVFGQSSQGTGSLFGGTPAAQGSIFGGGQSSSFATSGGGTIFGGSGGQSLFGNASSGSIFGQTSAASTPSPFSASTSKAESSPFGGSSVFGSGGGGGGGGGFFSGLGSKPSAESANKNVFGGPSLSSAAPQTSLFGNSSSSSSTSPFQGSVFGRGSTGGTTGTGSFSSGGGPVANTGFAVTSPQSPAFGGGASFGGSPAFGGAATFGSPPRLGTQSSVFGGSPSFSSPLSSSSGGGFGAFASSSGATFGSIAGSTSPSTSSSFGSFANQNNAASFGSLAQQGSNQPSGAAFGGGAGTSFGSGGSFSSWR